MLGYQSQSWDGSGSHQRKPPGKEPCPANLQAGPKKLHLYKEFNAFKFFPMQAVDQSLCCLLHNTVARLMTQAKSKKFGVGSNVRSCPLSSWKSIGFFSSTVERNPVCSLQLSASQALDPDGSCITLFPVTGDTCLPVPAFSAAGCTPSHQLSDAEVEGDQSWSHPSSPSGLIWAFPGFPVSAWASPTLG